MHFLYLNLLRNLCYLIYKFFYFSENAENKIEEKRIRADYDKKISSLKNDVRTIETARKQHVRLLNSSANEAQLKKLKQEVADMKRAKVNAMIYKSFRVETQG